MRAAAGPSTSLTVEWERFHHGALVWLASDRTQRVLSIPPEGYQPLKACTLGATTTAEVEGAIERERHLSELEALECETVATEPIRVAVDAWIEVDADTRSLRCLAKRLDVDAGYLARLIGRSPMQGCCKVDGRRTRRAFRCEMALEEAERIVRAIGLAPAEFREYGL